jgi:thioredoxin-related protein
LLMLKATFYSKLKSMKNIIILLFSFISYFSYAQSETGIKFQNNLSYEEILQKAKIEHKFIFFDIMATWCGPCKKMDKEVYTNVELGNFMNSRFISVKVQMDSTANDNAEVRSWYKQRKIIRKKYNIQAMPTFIFLSEDGELIHIDLSYKSVTQFRELAAISIDSNRNYAGLKRVFKEGTLGADQLLELASLCKRMRDDDDALAAAEQYKRRFIDKHSITEVINAKLPDFLTQFSSIFSFKDSLITYLYHNPEVADKLLGTDYGYSKAYTIFLITRDDINPVIWPSEKAVDNEPQWKKIKQSLANKYDENTAQKIILNTKIRWYGDKKNWQMLIKSLIARTDFNGIDTSSMGRIEINNMVFDVIFKYGTDKKDLQSAITYMEKILSVDNTDYSNIDTYANILYKAGHHKKALEEEYRAMRLATNKDDKSSVEEFKSNIKKMNNKLPTWN